jgi:hypothetical protein
VEAAFQEGSLDMHSLETETCAVEVDEIRQAHRTEAEDIGNSDTPVEVVDTGASEDRQGIVAGAVEAR